MKNEKFNSNWWDNFIKKTEKLSKTTIIKECILEDEIELMNFYILDILKSLAKLRTNLFGFRVYTDGILLDSNDMVLIYDAPPLENETLETWSNRVFGNKKFGMIINQGERININLSNLIAKKINPLIEKMGMPTEGIIFTLFIGNYDKTPLGIHLDLPGKSVIHFHLGPGSKTIYNWETETYEALAGEKKYNNQNIEKYLPYASKYNFKSGDIFFMPEDTYHIGTQEGLSVAIGCWYNNRSKEDFAKQLNTFILEKYLTKSKENFKADKNAIDDFQIVENSINLFEFPKRLDKLSFKDLIREEYKDFRYSLFSNAGYRNSPFPMTEDFDIEKNNIVEMYEPFKILYNNSSDEKMMNIYVRGIKIELNNFDCIKLLIDSINDYKPQKVEDLLKILDQSWDDEIGLYIISLFYKHHAIRILN